MQFSISIAALAAVLPLTTLAVPAPGRLHAYNSKEAEITPRAALTEADLVAIAPTSGTCAGAPFPNECSTAAQTLPHINNAFHKYGITHPSVQAALLSLMAYETQDFKYNKNHFPGRPGQGTRNMQSAAFNAKYATALGKNAAGDPQTVADQVEGDDDASFGSAAWFLTTQCPFAIRQGMWGGSETGWESYLSSCVGTSVDGGRREYWQRAVKALGSQ